MPPRRLRLTLLVVARQCCAIIRWFGRAPTHLRLLITPNINDGENLRQVGRISAWTAARA